MPQPKSQDTNSKDPGELLHKESEQERREEEGGVPAESQPGRGRRPDRHEPEEGNQRARLRGRQPSPEPDVFLDAPKVNVEEIYLDVEGMDAHLSLRAKLANLVQLVAGVHVHMGKLELDIKGVEAEAMLKVRLENLYDILDRALTTIDRNPQILEALLNTVDSAVDDIGQTAHAALGPQGAVSRTVDEVGQTAQSALRPGGAGSEALDTVGEAAEQAVGPGGAISETGQKVGAAVDDTGQAVGGVVEDVGAGAGEQRLPASRRAREGKTKRGSKRGTRLSRSDDDSEPGRVVRRAAKIGEVAQHALGHLAGGGGAQAGEEAADHIRQAAAAAVQEVSQAAGAAVQQVGQAAAKATEQLGGASVEANGKATWTPSKESEAAPGTGQRPAAGRRRSGEGQPKRRPERGTRSRSSGGDGK